MSMRGTTFYRKLCEVRDKTAELSRLSILDGSGAVTVGAGIGGAINMAAPDITLDVHD